VGWVKFPDSPAASPWVTTLSAAAPSLRPCGCRAPGRDRRAWSPDRALPFSSRTKRNSTLCRPKRAAGILPLAKVRWRPHGGGGSHGRGPGGHHGCYCNVTFSPAGFRNGRTAWRRASRPDSGRPARRRSTAFRDGWTASRRRASRNRCASERGLAMGGGRPAERRFSKSVARSHRTVLAYWKFESISLQRRRV
jgi:hypothetical protein